MLHDAQLSSSTVDVMKWNYQKVPVALGTDDEVRPGELSDLLFDNDGNWVRRADRRRPGTRPAKSARQRPCTCTTSPRRPC